MIKKEVIKLPSDKNNVDILNKKKINSKNNNNYIKNDNNYIKNDNNYIKNDNMHIININDSVNMKQQIGCCGKRILIRRLSLPCIGLLGLFMIDDFINYINVSIVIFIVSLCIFWNFPKLIIFTNSKPFYYEDLFVDTSHIKLLDINPKIKNKFETIFDCTLIITNSLFVSALSDYWLYKINDNDNYFVIIGITGGILKIFQFVSQGGGYCLLHIIRYNIMKNIRNKKRLIQMKEFEKSMDEVCNELHNVKILVSETNK